MRSRPASLNVGGRTIEENGAEYVVRGVGLITSAADLETLSPDAARGPAAPAEATSRRSGSAATSAVERSTSTDAPRSAASW
jgi:hypothetical protein